MNSNMLHIRYNGESLDFSLDELDVGDASTDNEVLAAMARRLNVDRAKLNNYQVDRADGEITVRPPATFG